MTTSERTIAALASYPMPSTDIVNRVNWQVEPQRAALLIHDMQYYFLKKYDMAAAPIPELIQHTQAIYAACKAAGIPVYYTAQPKEQSATDRALLNDFWGSGVTAPNFQAEQPIIEALQPADDDIVLTKWRYSAFVRSPLAEQLRASQRDQLIITGIYAHIGCMTTALDAFMQDIQPFFITDATADFSAKEHQMAIHHVSQRCGVCLTTQQLLTALSKVD